MIISSEPCIGTLNKTRAATKQSEKPIIAVQKYGIIFDNNISKGFMGEINNDSSVPRSHSRAITSEVKKTPTIVIISTIKPGIKYHVLELESLNHILFSIRILPALGLFMKAELFNASHCFIETSIYPFTVVAVLESTPYKINCIELFCLYKF